MLSTSFDVMFRLRAKTNPGEVLCVVGDCAQLGSWRPQHAKVLKRERQGTEEVWSRSIRLPIQDVQYRYFIGYIRDADHEGDEKYVMVRRWETCLKPRVFTIRSLSDPEDCREDAVFGSYNGETNIDKGWLTGQTEIHLRVHDNPIRMWKQKHRQQRYRIRCSAVDLRYKDLQLDIEGEESNHDLTYAAAPNRVTVSNLNGRDYIPDEQHQFGATYEENDYIIFRAQTFEPEYLGYQFDFFADEGADVPRHVGVAYLLPINVRGTNGIKNCPIHGLKQQPIGQFAVDYLVIRPLKIHACDMEVSYAKHWNRSRGPVDIGHRGMGSSYKHAHLGGCAVTRENTIASLAEAGGHGAHFVEFDVQLSRDDQVVIYHDFKCCLSLMKKGRNELEYFEIPVKDLTLQELQMLKLDHVTQKAKGSSPIPDSSSDSAECEADPEDRQPFPLLQQALQLVDHNVGFNIEIKYCMQLKSGDLEDGLTQYMERNKYLDLILMQVMQYGGTRRIIFTSFDPDVCTMVRMKQNRYPVGFLTQGNSARYESFQDMRTQSTPLSSSFARAEGFLALIGHSEDFFKDESLVQLAKDMGLVVFSWGDDANSQDNVKRLKAMGLDGVIYDRIHEMRDKKIFQLEANSKVLSGLAKLNANEGSSQAEPGVFASLSGGSMDTH